MSLIAYLNFDGTCADALAFYERALGGKIEFMMKFGDSPMAAEMPPGSAERIMHATLRFDGRQLMACDTRPDLGYKGMHGFSLSLSYDTAEKAGKVFDALAEGAQIQLPLQKTFWSKAFGMLTDRFGTPWMVSCETAQ